MSNVCIIAEAGVNHNGSLEKAKKLIDGAAKAGVDYVKFQTFKASKLVTKEASQAEYQKKATSTDSQYEMLKKLELSADDHYELIQYCLKKNVKFLSTAFDLESVDFLRELKLDLWKIPSGELTNYPYLKKIASFNSRVIVSTGMASMSEIKEALEVLTNNGTDKSNITVLHCNTEYPTPLCDVNLRAMQTIGSELNVGIGYSDHTLGILVPVAAVSLGAKVIEKHFTLDKNDEGPDHSASLDVEELVEMVKSIRGVEEALGSGEKKPSESEKKNIVAARKSIVASKSIKKGDTFSEENLTTKRPGDGISPMQWDQIIGKIAKKDYSADEKI